METQIKNRYEHFKVKFKDLDIEVKLLDNKATFPNTAKKDFIGFCEEFKVIMKNKDKEITYKFYNSIMEREISDALNNKDNVYLYNHGFMLNLKGFREFMNKKRWGGYDKIKSVKELTQERILNLIYSILNSFEMDRNTETLDFYDFCDSFGYDKDSRTAEKVYNAVIDFKIQARSLNLTDNQDKYFNEEVSQETEKFNQDLRKAIIEQTQ